MSENKAEVMHNDENLYPQSRKRRKYSTSTEKSLDSVRKKPNIELSSSPHLLTVEDLEQMGINMLDSEESVSSIASAIGLTLSTSPDENSNEATPNLDAPKYQVRSYNRNDTLDISTDSNNSTLVECSTTKKSGLLQYTNNNLQDIETHNNKVLEKIQDPLQRKISALSTETIRFSSGVGTASSANNIHSPAKNTRSPLATVVCNNQRTGSDKVQPNEYHTAENSPNKTKRPDNSQKCSCISVLPSTSKALRKHQEVLMQKRQQEIKDANLKNRDFFMFRSTEQNSTNYFGLMSDEIILQIFKWLSKNSLLNCSIVNQQFNRCARDEMLWARLDLGNRKLRPGAVGHILSRGVVVLRLSQTDICSPIFDNNFFSKDKNLQNKIQYLDLSLSSIKKPDLKQLLAQCKQLKKLSLEFVAVNDDICNSIGQNTNLEALNLAMSSGIEAWSMRKLMDSLKKLVSLNISWANLSVDAVTALVTNVTPNILRLNIAGCRKNIFDSHLNTLIKRCTQLLELDLSDCTALTGSAVSNICKSDMLEYVSLSRCYGIPLASFMELTSLPTLKYLDVFGMLNDSHMKSMERGFPSISFNKFVNSAVARPTVGTKRTSIWGLRTRD
ncbi:S-phase kinase-associated protein 2 isoform X2 [Teleopsis dalmanni]|uniref:S-phase kinase-associated protein 2 isoform X2 n=1 Tax=Teleopsis dalmanni TaxID=139649 RepID=UPI0018CDA208|nr:S-phase kinase-associated protein 2 isoform X2 [Teleopsis dalmanni]